MNENWWTLREREKRAYTPICKCKCIHVWPHYFYCKLFNRITLWLHTLYWAWVVCMCVWFCILLSFLPHMIHACNCSFAFIFISSHSIPNRNIKFNSNWVQSINFIWNVYLNCKTVGTPHISCRSLWAKEQKCACWTSNMRVAIATIIYVRVQMMMHQTNIILVSTNKSNAYSREKIRRIYGVDGVFQ